MIFSACRISSSANISSKRSTMGRSRYLRRKNISICFSASRRTLFSQRERKREHSILSRSSHPKAIMNVKSSRCGHIWVWPERISRSVFSPRYRSTLSSIQRVYVSDFSWILLVYRACIWYFGRAPEIDPICSPTKSTHFIR